MARPADDMALNEGMYLFYHVFLPPKLPQENDYDPGYENVLLDKVILALRDFSHLAPDQDARIVTAAITTISRLRDIIGTHGDLDEARLRNVLEQLYRKGGFLPIYVHKQNAAVLLSRNGDSIDVESFELSPRNESVNATIGRLQRQFPGPTLALDSNTFKDHDLQNVIAQTLARMSHEPVAGTKPKVKKAHQKHDEDRDTTHPKMVTEFFMAFLRPRCVDVDAPQIQKNTREEVLWHDCLSPWRRSALWLLVRVTLQLVFCRLPEEERADDLYKQFMVYFMGSIIGMVSKTMPSENLYAMNAKVARRLLKLGLSDKPAWLSSVQDELRRSDNMIQNVWRQEMRQQKSLQADMSSLASLNFSQDVFYTLPCLDGYLEGMEQRGLQRSPMPIDYQPKSSFRKQLAENLPVYLEFADTDYGIYNIAAFEEWIALNLDAWLNENKEKTSTCSRLGELMFRYHQAASILYSCNPEAISVMLLTLLELWIACDKSAIYNHYILQEYDPCIPVDVFQSLLLPFKSQMVRLARAEKYLCKRQQNSWFSGADVFINVGTKYCFSVRHFDQSRDHKHLYEEIEAWADRERTKKKQEFQDKKQLYEHLKQHVHKTECEYNEVVIDRRHNFREPRHSPFCTRCQDDSRADSINIDVHEWPLPTDYLQAKSVVFELSIPSSFGSWRDTTVFFILDVLKFGYTKIHKPRAEYRLKAYHGLHLFFQSAVIDQRICLLSENKPHEATHRKQKQVGIVTEDDVCLENGLHFRCFDDEVGYFTCEWERTPDSKSMCTYKLPQQSSSLQKFLFRPAEEPNGPSPNTVIATQSAAPMSMTLEEFRSLATMPLGIEVQWLNILSELSTSSVDFKKSETVIFFLQIMNQAGPPENSTHLRQGHMILGDPIFVIDILDRIAEVAGRIKENWELVQGLSCLIFLVLRILSLSPTPGISALCLQRLADFRKVAFHWVNLVRDKASQTTNDTQKTEFIAKYVHIALVCAETYDAESLVEIFATQSDVSIFIQCCMMIHDRKNALSITSDSVLLILYHRWQKLMYHSHSILTGYIVLQNNQGLDQAILEAWAEYRTPSSWSMALNEHDCWLMARTSCQSADETSKLVHYNLLTGELLVDGTPLARLPSSYERHSTYQSLFGRSQLEIVPSNSRGMQFSCKQQYMGHTIHFVKESISDSECDLMVKAVKDGRTWEFVPPRVLTSFFPDAFVEKHVHWYSVDDGVVEFRPVSAPWLSSHQNWRLSRDQSRNAWYLERQGAFLVSTDSPTAKVISGIFQPVEEALKLYCTLHEAKSILDIHLPRLQLGFSLQPQCSSIQSKQYPHMSVDPNQSLDSLIGLHNKLFLVHAKSQDRVLLIPEGEIFWEKDNHVDVRIGWQSKTKLHTYSIDYELGRLIDNGSLQSKLLLAYLHALTSFCLPDPLTRKTGTEQALSIIRSAAVRSFDRLQPEHVKMLEKIAALTPKRMYYPENERVMQSVVWEINLDFLSQHNDFYVEVRAIFDQDRRLGFFNPGTESIDSSLPSVEESLLRRDQIRASSFRVSGFGAEYHTREHDCRYDALDHIRDTSQASRVFDLCKMVYNEVPRVRDLSPETLKNKLWAFLSLHSEIYGPSAQIDTSRIRYDAAWVLESADFIAKYWCSLNRLLCSRIPRFNKFRLMIWLSTMAFSEAADMVVLETIASFFVLPEMVSVLSPSAMEFQLWQGYKINRGTLRQHILLAYLKKTPERKLEPNHDENHQQFTARKDRIRNFNREQVCKRIVNHVQRQWPTQSPSYSIIQENPRDSDYVNVQNAMDGVRKIFAIWYDNRELGLYLLGLATLLDRQPTQAIELPSYSIPEYTQPIQRRCGFICIDDLLGRPPNMSIACPELSGLLRRSPLDTSTASLSLDLVEKLRVRAKSKYELWYIEQLQSSVASLQDTRKQANVTLDTDHIEETLRDHLSLCQEYTSNRYSAIISEMSASSEITGIPVPNGSINSDVLIAVKSANQFPRLSPNLLLEQLSHYRWNRLPMEWKQCITTYGCSITALQRAKRMASLAGNDDGLLKELQNPGHTNWDPLEFPESLLLEIENGILIRNVQEDIAREMRTFGSGENAVMQLNMGEGKSSVIVPIVAVALASHSCLARVLVAKPQSRQMFHMLVSKIGGILGRRVYHMPISRALELGEAQADEIYRMCQECMLQGGVLLVQPEHVLSLKLKCLESFIVGKPAVGNSLLRTLNFFEAYSRDVVDESDENFNVKLELIYTMGSQRPVELSPQRWILIQQLLGLVRRYAPSVKEKFPQSIEAEQQSVGFPRVRLLDDNSKRELFGHIAKHICDNGIGSLPISRQHLWTREAIRTYIFKSDLTDKEIADVEGQSQAGFWTESTRMPLLLLRGLLAGGILAFCLGQKRWRVNYGPDPSRDPPTKLCVPYRAKDNPSPRSEFSHPDVVITLTSLNYYYAGLDDEDLFLAFNHLCKSDQADTEYQLWVNDAPMLPRAYRQLVGINLDDRYYCMDNIFPNIRFSKPAIDYFLNQVVFPREMKEFPDKLSASGWDIGEIKTNPTVGFSGTNDSRKTLPLGVRQLDLPEQNHTNALVLEHLLQPENSVVFIPDKDKPSTSDAQLLLDLVLNLDPPVQVILDVGAQILELSNLQLAERWLAMLPKEGPIQAVVFANDSDEICVLDRNGRVEPLQISPFMRRMEACFVFLDEAHTRGIDLKLPVNYRAAVTLGPGITKDKLVQACMRMRKLGNGQSVVFCVPKEVKLNILKLNGKYDESSISVSDVLCWAVSETWTETRRSMPLWAVQGNRFERQLELWHNARQGGSLGMTSDHAEGFLEPECQTIEQRYQPIQNEVLTEPPVPSDHKKLRLIFERCREFDNLDFRSSTLHEEQERELAPEIETERQVQRPPEAAPSEHYVHQDLYAFVNKGKLKKHSDAYEPAFQTLANTSAASTLDISQFPTGLLATKDFATTVKETPGSRLIGDCFQRPVRWILTRTKSFSGRSGRQEMTRMLIISPYEANFLLPIIQKSEFVRLHLYAPRQNQGFSPFDKLTLYTIPRSSDTVSIPDTLRIQLNLFAGQLYLETYSGYHRLCNFLGVASVTTPDNMDVAADGFILRGNEGSKTTFSQSPLKFLRTLATIRKDGQDIGRTHIGQIVDGRLLSLSDFDVPWTSTVDVRR